MKTNAANISRRQFIRYSGLAAGASLLPFPYIGKVLGANGKVAVGCIGVGGKGSSDCDNSATCGANIVAICDVDEITLKKKAEKFPNAKQYRDFRKMLEEMGSSI